MGEEERGGGRGRREFVYTERDMNYMRIRGFRLYCEAVYEHWLSLGES